MMRLELQTLATLWMMYVMGWEVSLFVIAVTTSLGWLIWRQGSLERKVHSCR